MGAAAGDYFLVKGEPRGRWWGTGARELGLAWIFHGVTGLALDQHPVLLIMKPVLRVWSGSDCRVGGSGSTLRLVSFPGLSDRRRQVRLVPAGP
jgi:hypothetical protein